MKKNTREILIGVLISIVVIALAFYLNLFVVPLIKMEPNYIEKKKMLNKLYEIESIVLFDNKGKKYMMDIEEFRELLPEAEPHFLIITKGQNIEGKAIMKDDSEIKVYLSQMYLVFRLVDEDSEFTHFTLSESIKDEWFELIKKTLQQ